MKWNNIIAIFTALVLSFAGMTQSVFAQAPGFPKINAASARPQLKKPSSKFHSTERKVQFIGKPADILNFNENDLQSLQNYLSASAVMLRSGEEPGYADSGLVIVIDTSQFLGVNEGAAKTAGGTTRYDGHPVIIKNSTDNRLVVGAGNQIPIVIEALDKGNNWRTVEGNLNYNRNPGSGKIILGAGDIVGVVIPIYSGSFKTVLRVRVFGNYSESFTGYLNPSQLIQPVE